MAKSFSPEYNNWMVANHPSYSSANRNENRNSLIQPYTRWTIYWLAWLSRTKVGSLFLQGSFPPGVKYCELHANNDSEWNKEWALAQLPPPQHSFISCSLPPIFFIITNLLLFVSLKGRKEQLTGERKLFLGSVFSRNQWMAGRCQFLPKSFM